MVTSFTDWGAFEKDLNRAVREMTRAEAESVLLNQAFGFMKDILKRSLDQSPYIAKHKVDTRNHLWVAHFDDFLLPHSPSYKQTIIKEATEKAGSAIIEKDIREVENKGIAFDSTEISQIKNEATRNIDSFRKVKSNLEFLKDVPASRLESIKKRFEGVPTSEIKFTGYFQGRGEEMRFRIRMSGGGKSADYLPEEF